MPQIHEVKIEFIRDRNLLTRNKHVENIRYCPALERILAPFQRFDRSYR
jgi:hypothetical protein